MIPDKIYIDDWAVVNDYVTKISTEYIRKDALMKIIATARKSAIIQRNFNNCPTEQEARIDAYDYIKHEIESL